MLNNAHSLLVSLARGGRGLIVTAYNQAHPPRPDEPLELYQFEACPYCRKVREVMSELDLAYISRASARGATTNRRRLEARGGKRQCPYLVDPNTGEEMYEAEDIIDYLVDTYGDGRNPVARLLSPMNTASAAVASALRPRGGRVAKDVRDRPQPDELLVLYNFEASPFCRKVRETLDELGLDHLVKNVAKKSKRRPELIERGGQMMVPYLADPNTGEEMYESDDIVAYLEETYG
ncbi:MAG: glutathione S-transferase N-terminal domain-containing protein [Persicimonas sp.]